MSDLLPDVARPPALVHVENVVDCTGLSRARVLRALYEAAPLAEFLRHVPDNDIGAPSEPDDVAFELAARRYVDYCAGRRIKTDFRTFPCLLASPYDAGWKRPGTMARVIARLRAQQ